MELTKILNLGSCMKMKSYEFSTSKNSSLFKFPCFELDKDKMACSKSAPTDKLHQGSNESSFFTSSFSQNFCDELCYSQAPSYNKSPNRADFQNHTGSVVLNPCEATSSSSVENKCSKPSYEKNPIDKLLFMQNNYFTSL